MSRGVTAGGYAGADLPGARGGMGTPQRTSPPRASGGLYGSQRGSHSSLSGRVPAPTHSWSGTYGSRGRATPGSVGASETASHPGVRSNPSRRVSYPPSLARSASSVADPYGPGSSGALIGASSTSAYGASTQAPPALLDGRCLEIVSGARQERRVESGGGEGHQSRHHAAQGEARASDPAGHPLGGQHGRQVDAGRRRVSPAAQAPAFHGLDCGAQGTDRVSPHFPRRQRRFLTLHRAVRQQHLSRAGVFGEQDRGHAAHPADSLLCTVSGTLVHHQTPHQVAGAAAGVGSAAVSAGGGANV
eukprot:ctg_872.g315